MMYLNVNVGAGPQGDSACTTPRTPEILNSLMALSNPFDNYPAGDVGDLGGAGGSGVGAAPPLGSPPLATSPSDAGLASYPSPPPSSASSPCSSTSSSSSALSSPAPNTTPRSRNNQHAGLQPPVRSRAHSVQHTRSQLIKESLKLTITTKRMATGRDQVAVEPKIPKREELTTEDEERRRRRRERNKIAATKCRNKKKEKTVHLVQESECLEGQNVSLKTEIQKLEAEKQRLMDILSMHAPACMKSGVPPTTDTTGSTPTTTPTPNNHNHTNSYGHNTSCSYPSDGVNGYCTTANPSVTAPSTSCASTYQYSSCSFNQGGSNSNPFLGYSGMDSGCVAL